MGAKRKRGIHLCPKLSQRTKKRDILSIDDHIGHMRRVLVLVVEFFLMIFFEAFTIPLRLQFLSYILEILGD